MSQMELPKRGILRRDLHVKFIKGYFHACGRYTRKEVGQREKLGCDAVSAKSSVNSKRNPECDMTLQSFPQFGQECQIQQSCTDQSLNAGYSGQEPWPWLRRLSSTMVILKEGYLMVSFMYYLDQVIVPSQAVNYLYRCGCEGNFG